MESSKASTTKKVLLDLMLEDLRWLARHCWLKWP